jgi:hypothetical protein
MDGGIFLTAKDLQLLMGIDSYSAASRIHLGIRDALGKKNKRLTIKEYCEFEELDFEYVWTYLRIEKRKRP